MAGITMSPEFRDQVVDTVRTVRKTSRGHDPLKQGRLQTDTRYQGYFQTELAALGESDTAPPTAEFEIWAIDHPNLTISATGVIVTVTNRQCDLTISPSDLTRIESVDGEWRPYVWEDSTACSESSSISSQPSEPESSEPSEPSEPSESSEPSEPSDPSSSDPSESDPSGSDPSGSSGPSESSPGQSTLSQSDSGSLSDSFSQGSRSSGSGSDNSLSTSVSSVSISGSSGSSSSSSGCNTNCYCFLPTSTITGTFGIYEDDVVSTSGLLSHEAVDEGVDSSDDAATAVRPGTNSSNNDQVYAMRLDGDTTSDPAEDLPFTTITGVKARMRARVIQYGTTTPADQEIDVTIGDDGDAENAGSVTFTVSGTDYATYEEDVTGGITLPASVDDIDWDEFVDRWVMEEDRKNETSFEISAIEICVEGS